MKKLYKKETQMKLLHLIRKEIFVVAISCLEITSLGMTIYTTTVDKLI